MPARAYHPLIRQQVLDRVAAGEHLIHVCAEPGMPSYASFYAWSRAEPDFAESLAAARRRGAHRRRLMFDEDQAKALLARLAAGESIVSILRDPAMPSRRVYAYWRATHGGFQEEVFRLNRLHADLRAQRNRRHPLPFDQALADRIVARVARGEPLQGILNAANGLPCRTVVIRWRREQAEFDLALRIAMRVGRRQVQAMAAAILPKDAQAICDAIREGASLNEASRRPGMPSAATLYAWMRKRPAFAAEVLEALEDRQDLHLDRLLMLSETPESFRANRREFRNEAARLTRLQNRLARRRAD